MIATPLMPDVAFAPITEGVKLEVSGFKSVPVPLFIPVTFGGNADLAAKIGTLHAIAVQHLEYLSRVLDGRMKDGKKWVRVVMKSEDESITWCSHFGGEEEKTIRGVLADLRADGLIEVTTFKGRPKWYYLNLNKVLSLTEPVARVAKKKSTKQKNLTKKALRNQTIPPNRTNINTDETPLNVCDLIGGIMCPNRSDTCDLIGGIMCPNRTTSNILSNTANIQSNTPKDFAAQNAASKGEDSLNPDFDLENKNTDLTKLQIPDNPGQETPSESTPIQAEVTAPP